MCKLFTLYTYRINYTLKSYDADAVSKYKNYKEKNYTHASMLADQMDRKF
jgi:hypothetical protein